MTLLRRWELPHREALGPTPEAFLERLEGPALLRIPGRDRSRTRVVSTLLHGNEPSGLRALHAWLRSGGVPAVDALCFVGAVEAARTPPGFVHRMLPGRRDLNRCFHPPFEGDEGALAAALLAAMRSAPAEALLDLHNNTGHNPPYAVGTRVDEGRLALAALAADRFIHSDLRLGTLTEATEEELPGITLECGRAGDPRADAVARVALERFLEPPALPAKPERPLALLHAPVRVTVRPGVRLAFGEGPVPGADLTVAADVDRHNFERLEPGAPVGWLRGGRGWPLEARGAEGRDVAEELFRVHRGRLEIVRPLVPIMMTTDPAVALADCLFYAVRPGSEEP